MTMTNYLTRPVLFLVFAFAAIGFMPTLTHAAEAAPECLLIASTPRGYEVFTGEKDIEIHAAERVILAWIGINTTMVENRTGKGLSNVGLEVFTATGSGEFSYTFGNDRGTVTCTANLQMKSVSAPTTEPVTVDTRGSSVVVSDIPLLSGGVATAGMSIPVTYVKVENTSTAYASIKGFTLTQNGTADTDSIIGFTTSDNQGGSRTTIGGVEGNMPFDGNEVYVPLQVTLAPREFRIYTLKAILTRASTGEQGRTIALNLSGIDTTARISGAFPIRGTTWTLGF